ncbi:MAG: hypothetical protein U0V74_13725 [Chitinophagales bacterium]
MKHLKKTIIVFIVALTACGGLTDNRADLVKQALSERVSKESEGAMSLSSFKKTNAVEQEFAGMKAYVVEFEAVIKIEKECWKAGNGISGYFDNYRVRLTAPQGGWDSYDMGNPKHFAAGEEITFKGEGTLVKKENGWEVDKGSVHVQDGAFKR